MSSWAGIAHLAKMQAGIAHPKISNVKKPEIGPEQRGAAQNGGACPPTVGGHADNRKNRNGMISWLLAPFLFFGISNVRFETN